MAMTFEEMCAACPRNTNFAINNIPKGDYQEWRRMVLEINHDCELPKNLNDGCYKNLSIRFDNVGNFAGWIDDDSYFTIIYGDIRDYVKGGNYEFADMEFYPQATLDVMSVL